jgi:hypothetical protein
MSIRGEIPGLPTDHELTAQELLDIKEIYGPTAQMVMDLGANGADGGKKSLLRSPLHLGSGKQRT